MAMKKPGERAVMSWWFFTGVLVYSAVVCLLVLLGWAAGRGFGWW